MDTQIRSLPNPPPTRAGTDASVLVAGAVLLLVVVALDFVVSDRAVAEEGPPILSGVHLVRTAALALGSAALVLGGRRVAVRFLDRADVEPSGAGSRPAAGVGMVPALVSVVLIVRDPGLLSRLVREDHVVEWASALLAFGAGAAFAAAAGRWRRHSVPAALAALSMAGVCLLLGLEEISWFQRVLDIESPDFMLNRNGQQETNLHNLATGATGNAYYVAACVYLVLIPAMVGDRRLPSLLSPLQAVLPSPVVLLGAASAAGFVYAMWNIAWIQATFWVTLCGLAVVARDRRHRRVAIGVAVLTALTAAVFLLEGDSMIRDWDDTEIRELVIPYGLFLGGLEAVRRAGSEPVGR